MERDAVLLCHRQLSTIPLLWGGAGAQWSIKSILAKKLKKIFLTKMVQFNSAHKINLLGMFYKKIGAIFVRLQQNLV
jgi:hypothetical protein